MESTRTLTASSYLLAMLAAVLMVSSGFAQIITGTLSPDGDNLENFGVVEAVNFYNSSDAATAENFTINGDVFTSIEAPLFQESTTVGNSGFTFSSDGEDGQRTGLPTTAAVYPLANCALTYPSPATLTLNNLDPDSTYSLQLVFSQCPFDTYGNRTCTVTDGLYSGLVTLVAGGDPIFATVTFSTLQETSHSVTLTYGGTVYYAAELCGFVLAKVKGAAPAITSISPNPVNGSNSVQTITVTGTGFASGMTGVAAWSTGSAPLSGSSQIVVDSATQARIFITTQTDPDNWTLQFTNQDGQSSNVFAFQVVAPTVGNPAPAITSISPNPVTGSTSQQTLTVTGTGFVAGMTGVATWSTGSAPLSGSSQIVVDSATQARIFITTQTDPDNWTLQFMNQDGQSSNVFAFQVVAPVVNPAPAIASISPNPVTGSNSVQTITVTGTGFASGITGVAAWSTGSAPLSGASQIVVDSATQARIFITTQTTPDNWTLQVTNPDGQASNVFAFQVVAPVVNPAPAITSPLSTAGVVGQPFDYQIAANNQPIRFAAVGLPPGLSLNSSGLISGTPTTAGNTNVAIQATDANNNSASAVLALTISQAGGNAVPAISSPASASGTVGTAFNYPIVASNQPSSFGATGLPPGLNIDTGGGVISGTPTIAGTYPVGITATNATGTGSATLTITIAPPPSTGTAPLLTLSMHTASANVIVNKDSGQGIDVPLELWARQSALLPSQPPVSQGLVADGVTPLIFEFTAAAAPASDVDYNLSFNVTDGGTLTGGFLPFLRVLQPGASPVFVTNTSTLRLAAGSTTAFAYITGMDASNIAFKPGSYALSVTMTVQPPQGIGSTSYLQFKVRRPPIMLVHGYNSSNAAWSLDFQSPLNAAVGSDFVRLIEYGTQSSNPGQPDNRTGSFATLASELDSRLTYELSDPVASFWRQGWAMTRYDIVGHSQGGVLTRMLCTSNNPASGLAFRSSNNFYRGRFRRIITIGSPHLGSTFAHYLIEEEAQNNLSFYSALPIALQGLLQDKFDPWGTQIHEINGADWRVDPQARFHLLTTSIYGGQAPPYVPLGFNPEEDSLAGLPLAYGVTGLYGRPSLLATKSRGNVVLPDGSDGVVDSVSQYANGDTPATDVSSLSSTDIAHSPPDELANTLYDPIFAVGPEDTDTNYEYMGDEVAALLTGPVTQTGGLVTFGPFELGSYATGTHSAIDAVVPGFQVSATIVKINSVSNRKPGLFTKSASNSQSYQYRIIADPNEPIDSAPAWDVEVYDDNGITSDGVTVEADASDPTIATVSVDASVTGEVVVFANYGSQSGKVIAGNPIQVAPPTTRPAMTGIELLPGVATVSPGSKLPVEIWADYADGTRAEMYVPSDAPIDVSSSRETVAKVRRGRLIVFKKAGKTKLTVNYSGFSASKKITVAGDPPEPQAVQPPTLTIVASVAQALEATSQAGIFTVTRTGDLFGDLVVPYQVKGSAKAGTNYQPLSGSVTIPDGSATATISVVPIDDRSHTRNLNVKVILSAGAGYQIEMPGKAKITIIDKG